MKGKPVHLAYVVEDIGEGEAFWTCIGAAFAHQDRNGMNIVLRALPTNGRIVLRRFTDRPVTKESLPELATS